MNAAIGFIRTLAAVLFLFTLVPLAALIAFPWTFISGKPDFLYAVGMGFAHYAVRIAGVKIRMVGMDQFDPAGTYIFMSNHVSNLDPPVLIPMIPRRTSVLAKRELWKIPILAKALDLAEIVPVERNNRESAIESIRRASEVMRHGINMTIYPEGTRSRDGRLLPFKKGPFPFVGGNWISHCSCHHSGNRRHDAQGALRGSSGHGNSGIPCACGS